MNKKELRSEMRNRRAALTEAGRARAGEAILARVVAMAEYRAAGTVFCYVSTGAEPDTHALIRRALADGKRVAVPRCAPEPGVMHACPITALEELRPAAMGLLEPGADAPAIEAAEIELAIVPCVACDEACGRLGQGGGYYDRFLKGRAFPAVALSYEATICPRLQAEEWDEPVDMVVTEERFIKA